MKKSVIILAFILIFPLIGPIEIASAEAQSTLNY